MTQTRMF